MEENENDYSDLKKIQTIGIRREDKSVFERRTPLIPEHCKELIHMGARVIFQPSGIRCFTDDEFINCGAEPSESLDDADLIIAIKEVPPKLLLPDKTYMFYSHTIKGQSRNLPILRECLEKKIRLIDYECMKRYNEVTGRKEEIVSFGRYAGIVGAIDFLQGMGRFLITKGLNNPFLYTGLAYMYPRLSDAKAGIERMGQAIKDKLIPSSLCPFIIGITSNGRVSHGVQEILNCLPHEFVDPDDLPQLMKRPHNSSLRDKVFITIIRSKHMFVHKQRKVFDEDFYNNPQNYESVFMQKFASYLSCLYHCMFWDQHAPKIITQHEAKQYSKANKFRIMGICDITCDVGGSIELLKHITTVADPFYTIDLETHLMNRRFEELTDKSILYHAVDHLPCELPIDASIDFSHDLLQVIKKMIGSVYTDKFEEESVIPKEIKEGCETWNGRLCTKYSYLYKNLSETM